MTFKVTYAILVMLLVVAFALATFGPSDPAMRRAFGLAGFAFVCGISITLVVLDRKTGES